MAFTTPPTERALLALQGVVIAVLLTTGIVGAVKVSNRSSSKVAAGADQPSVGPRLLPGPPPDATSTSLLPASTTAPVPTVPLPTVVAGGSSSAPAGPNNAVTASTVYTPTTTVAPTTTQPSCTASVSNPTPQPGQKETVSVASHLDSAAAMVTVHYASGDAAYKAKTSPSGQGQVSFTVPGRALPGSVPVDVMVGGQEWCQTIFTIV